MFDYILYPFKTIYNYTYDFCVYTVLRYPRPRKYRRRNTICPTGEFEKSISKYQRFPAPKWYMNAHVFDAHPINSVYNYIVARVSYEQFHVRRLLWLKCLRTETFLLNKVFLKRRYIKFMLHMKNIGVFLDKNYFIQAVLFIIPSLPIVVFRYLNQLRRVIQKNYIKFTKWLFYMIERTVALGLYKQKLLPHYKIKIIRFVYYVYFKNVLWYYIYYIIPYLRLVLMFCWNYFLIYLFFFINYCLYFKNILIQKSPIFVFFLFKTICLIIINNLLILITKIIHKIINLYFFKKTKNINELKINNLYFFKQFSENCLKKYNLFIFIYHYYIYFWLEYFFYSIIAIFCYPIILYKNTLIYYKILILYWIYYLRVYIGTSIYNIIQFKFYLEWWIKLASTYKKTYNYLFGLGYDTYFYIFVKYLAIYSFKTVIFFGCWAFFDGYAFYTFYRLIIRPIIRFLVRLFYKYVYYPCIWMFTPYPERDWSLKYWFFWGCFYSTNRYFDDISGDEEEEDEEDALISPMAVGYYDGFVHKDLFEDFHVYFSEDAIDYHINRKIPWAERKLKSFIS